MPVMRVCAECGELAEGTYCPTCSPPAAPKAGARQRGYDTAWDRLSRRARRLQPFCSDCFTTIDLQVDHTPRAWRRKTEGKVIRLKDVVVRCGPCNRAQGSARPGSERATTGDGVSETRRDPRGKANFGTLSEGSS